MPHRPSGRCAVDLDALVRDVIDIAGIHPRPGSPEVAVNIADDERTRAGRAGTCSRTYSRTRTRACRREIRIRQRVIIPAARQAEDGHEQD